MEQIYQHVWIHLPKEVRLHLVKVFALERTGVAEVRDQEVISDGFNNEDLKKITLEAMNAYIGSKEKSFMRAWEITLSKVNSELNPPVGVISATEVAPEEMTNPTAVGEAEVAAPAAEEATSSADINTETAPVTEEKPVLCFACGSKEEGVHAEGCPKAVSSESNG